MVPAALEHPANQAFCRHFWSAARPNRPAVERPDEVDRPYQTLGTHPDLVGLLWDELPVLLPVDCRFVVFNMPALVRPDTGIVFGFAGGTHTYALRLPEDARREALAAGATRVRAYPRSPRFDLADIGPEWVFGQWLKKEPAWCAAAYEFAGAPVPKERRRLMQALAGMVGFAVITWLIWRAAAEQAAESPSARRRILLKTAAGVLVGAVIAFWIPTRVPETPGSPGTLVMLLLAWLLGGGMIYVGLVSLVAASLARPGTRTAEWDLD